VTKVGGLYQTQALISVARRQLEASLLLLAADWLHGMGFMMVMMVMITAGLKR
jgi:hypothetical protein